MTVSTFYGDPSDGRIRSNNATYATAAAGGTFVVNTTDTDGFIGQSTGYFLHQIFLAFDTSSIPDTDVISSVVLSLDGSADNTVSQDFIATVLGYDWSAGGLTSADWRNPTQLSALTTLATFNSTGYSTGYMAFTSAGAAFNSYINKTGFTYFMVASNRNASATVPITDENFRVRMADFGGTTETPKLVVTHAPAGGGGFQSAWAVNSNKLLQRGRAA